MGTITFHWKNFRDNAGVETANRLTLLFVYQALQFPGKKIRKIENAQQYDNYKKNFDRLKLYKILERSSLWEDKYEALLTHYFEAEKSVHDKKNVKNLIINIKNNVKDIRNNIKETRKKRKEIKLKKQEFYKDLFESIKLHKKSFKDGAEIFFSWGSLFFVIGIITCFFMELYGWEKKINLTWSDFSFGGCFTILGFLMICRGVKDFFTAKSMNPERLIKYIDNDFCFEKLNDELDLVSSYFTDESKKRQIIDLKLNINFKSLSEASKEFEYLICRGIEENYFIYDGQYLRFIRENFPKYVFPQFLQCEDFFKDYNTEKSNKPFYEAMKKELDALIKDDSKKCGGNNQTKAYSAWNPNGKDLRGKFLKMHEEYEKTIK